MGCRIARAGARTYRRPGAAVCPAGTGGIRGCARGEMPTCGNKNRQSARPKTLRHGGRINFRNENFEKLKDYYWTWSPEQRREIKLAWYENGLLYPPLKHLTTPSEKRFRESRERMSKERQECGKTQLYLKNHPEDSAWS